jgi:ferredoxin
MFDLRRRPMKKVERATRGGSRRQFLKATGAGLGALAGVPAAARAFDLDSFLETWLQKHFLELSQEELDRLLARLERKYTEEFGKSVSVGAVGPQDGVVFAYGLDISRCIGCRRCVYACVEENNPASSSTSANARFARSISRRETCSTTTKACRKRTASTSRSPASNARSLRA